MKNYKQNIKTFLDRIFISLDPEEHIITCASNKSSPGSAKSVKDFFSVSHKFKACYFSTATAIKDPDYGLGSDVHYSELRNQKKFFSKMYCIVLDDVGTGEGSKCSPLDLPKMLREEYSWRVESSPNNFQYGYLLDKPIDDVNAASDLISLIYGAGSWDSGGAIANKLVRLPCGINIKKKYATEKGYFEVKDADPSEDPFNTFTPDELLEAVNAGVTWQDVLQGAACKKDPRKSRGTAPWREGGYIENLSGVVDPVVEFLNDQDMIVTEGGEWLEIVCPWCDEHSAGTGNTAGYSPLGFGDDPERRGFNCFHGHCTDHTATDFLIEIQKKGGPEVGTVDHAPIETCKWVYVANSSTGFYLNITQTQPAKYSPSSWRQMFCKKAFYLSGEKTKCTQQWKLMEENVLTLEGVKYEPNEPLIIESKEETKFLNLFKRPHWESEVQTNNMHNTKKFMDFINYLIPDKEDAKWFIDHLAAKVQNHEMRGPCTVLTTPIQGSGRGTLSKMLGQLWGCQNIATVGLGELLNGLSGAGFNDWMQNSYVIVPEAKDFNLNPRQEHAAYESLKSGIDPAPTFHVLKTKYGSQASERVYSTYIICSNHANTLNIPLNDRRFKFIRCVTRVETPEYFADLYDWLETGWEPSIWMMLKNRDLSQYDAYKSVAVNVVDQTSNNLDLIEQRSTATETNKLVIAAILFAEEYCEGILSTKMLVEWISQYPAVCGAPATTYWESSFKKALNGVTETLQDNGKCPKKHFVVGGKKYYLRHTIENKGKGQISAKALQDDGDCVVARFRQLITACDAELFRDFVIKLNDETE